MRAGEQVAGRLFDAAVAAMDVLSVALGNDLGYYRCLAQHGELTAAELADETETVERYASEWLEQQAATGLLKLAGGSADPSSQRFTLSPGVQEVMTDADSLLFLAPLARQLVVAARQLPAIAQAARTGGVGWSAYGTDMRESEADLNRAAYLQLITDWLAALPDITDRLSDDPRPGWPTSGAEVAGRPSVWRKVSRRCASMPSRSIRRRLRWLAAALTRQGWPTGSRCPVWISAGSNLTSRTCW